jgi:hypothetical protein
MNQRVNGYFLSELLNGLSGMGDDDEMTARFQGLDGNNAAQVKEVIAAELKPTFDSRSEKYREACRTALRYYLSKPGARFERVFYANLLPLSPPSDVREFFVWVWEVFFPGQDYHVPDLSEFEEVNDIREPLMIDQPK